MKKNILGFLFSFFVLSFLPSFVFAANIYFESSRDTVSVGDTFIISAKIDSEKESINSVEGDFVLGSNNNLIVNDFSLAKSIFSLWPKTPSLSEDGKTISFVGGVPGGFDLNKAIIFNIIFEATKEGNIEISPKNIAVYANDGKGSRINTDVSSLSIKILPKNESVAVNNEWSSLVSSDKKSPEKFDIIVGRDNSLFDGKRFAFFTAVDNQSGISYYEVSENGGKAIRSGSMYILSNQDDKVDPDLKVTAYDKAGNTITSVYKKPGFMIYGFSLQFFIIILIIVIIWFVFRKIKKSRKNKNSNESDIQ